MPHALSWARRTVIVAAILLAGCSNGDVTGPGDSGPSPGGSPQLSKQQTIRALAARERVSRRSARPAQTMLRRYDREGRLLAEYVRREGKWEARPSTLNPEVMAQSLSRFIDESNGAPNLRSPLSADTSWADDSAGTYQTDLVADSSSLSQSQVTASAGPWGNHALEVFYNSAGGFTSVDSTVAGVLYFPVDEYADVFDEVSLSGSDWQYYRNYTEPSLRTPSPLTGLPCEVLSTSPLLGATRFDDFAGVSSPRTSGSGSAMLPEDPCHVHYEKRVSGFLIAGGSIVGALGCSTFFAPVCGGAVPSLFWVARYGAARFAYNAIAFKVCRTAHPIGSF